MSKSPKAPNKKDKIRTRQTGGRGKPRPLRGEKLVRAAHALLVEGSNLSPKIQPINVSTLAEALGVTRQAIYNNNLDVEVDKYREIQRKNDVLQNESEASRRPLEERIKAKDEETADLRRKLDGWIERWVTVEYNARMQGIDADKIFAPMPPPDRNQVGLGRGRKGKDDDDG